MTTSEPLLDRQQLDADDRRFIEALSRLKTHIPERKQTIGRPRLPLADMVVACVYMVYSNCSSRAFVERMRQLHAAGVLSHVPHFNSLTKYLSDPELMPAVERLIDITSAMLGPMTEDEQDRLFESSTWSSRDWCRQGNGIAEENTALCDLLCVNLRELLRREP